MTSISQQMNTKNFLILILLLWTSLAVAQNNVAYQDNEVRFTVITDGVIRLEWQPEGKFTDSPSFVASERNYPEVTFKVRNNGGKVKIETAKMTLEYRKGSGKFNGKNLKITSGKGIFPEFTWKPGMKQEQNLKGTFRTLDGLDGDRQTQALPDSKVGDTRQFEDGLIAKDGWTLIDDSSSLLFDDSEWAWAKTREAKECQDWYFMAYGHDYKAALKDFTVFAGKMPLPPRYTFGYWWSRYWAYSDREFRKLVDKFDTYGIPLDVLVIDMDWHYTDLPRGGWTGWTWNRSLFPDPEKFMDDMKDRGLKLTLNLHPADGFRPDEERYPVLAESLGLDPTDRTPIEWTSSDKAFMENMFRHVMRPMQEEGVDFWWLDWQQYVYDKKMPQLHNTWWLNYCYFSDMERYGDKRPMLYHRWGGLGNHRYQIGFSGDATSTWKSLDFQPYFTSTSSNVLYGYWSHDLGGHIGESIDPEMYTRWLQFGGFSPVMRTHSTKSIGMNKEPWMLATEYTDIVKQTVRQRYDMVPYIYTMARKGYDEGISLCRPLYYDYPECQEAYDFRNEYMFGDNMLIAPITSPMENGYTEMEIWLPEGNWYEFHTGILLEGGKVVKRHFALDEYGVYIKAGAVLPFYGEDVSNLNGNDEDIYVTVFPGDDGEFLMYEDAGNDKDYASEYAVTGLYSNWTGNIQTVRIASRNGSYKGMPSDRNFKVKIVASEAPASVTVNGKAAEWSYLEEGLSFIIDVPCTDCGVEKVIEITYETEFPVIADGFIGFSRRIAKAIEAMKASTGIEPTDDLALMGNINEAIKYDPENASAIVGKFMENYSRLPEILDSLPRMDSEKKEWFLQHCGWNR